MSVCLFYLDCKEVAFCRAMQFTCNCCLKFIGYSDNRTKHLSIYVMKNMIMYISLKQSTIFNQSSYFLSVICQNMVIISKGHSNVERVRTDQQIKYQIIFNLHIVWWNIGDSLSLEDIIVQKTRSLNLGLGDMFEEFFWKPYIYSM